MKKRITILGSTGSIGRQTLDVVEAYPENFQVTALAAGRNVDLLIEQIQTFKPELVSVSNDQDATKVQTAIQSFGLSTQVVTGPDKLVTIATHPSDLAVIAIVGTTSLLPTIKAIEAGISIGLASKEILVAAGDIVMAKAREHNVELLPIDSEHAAIHQCLAGTKSPQEIDKLILTASGGPFFNREASTFGEITLKDALNHPNWSMGQKITIDSSTLVNKGLEVIEAHHLFNIPFSQIDVVIHPQSIIHSLVEFVDGNILAHLGLPDMRFPIQYVLTYPEKLPGKWPRTKLSQLKDLQFFDPDFHKFPLLKMAFQCGEKGGIYPCVFNAANEAAVALFLEEKISYLDIQKVIVEALEQTDAIQNPTLEDIIQTDLNVKEKILTKNSSQELKYSLT